MELVYIEWEDASAVDGETGWVDLATAAKPDVRMFKQVGFVVDIDINAVILTEAHDSDGTIAPRTRVPLCMIRRWVDLDNAVKEPT